MRKTIPRPTAEELSEIIPDYIEIDFPEGPLRGFLMIQRIVRGKAPPQEQTPSGKGRVPILIAEQKEGRNWEVGYLEGRYENGLPIITNPDQMLIAIPADVLASAFVKLLMVLFIQMAVEGIIWRSLDPLTGEEIPKPSLNPPPPPPDPE